MTDFEDKQAANNETIEDAMNSVQEVSVSDIAKGEVLAVEDKQVVVGIEGAGVEGAVPAKELSTLPVEDVHGLMKVGDVLGLVVITSTGKDERNGSYLLLKRRPDAKKVWEEIEQGSRMGKVVEVPITNVIKGGLVADVGTHGFVPASMIEDHLAADFFEYKGQVLAFKITGAELSENCLILSHEAIVEAEKGPEREESLSSLHDGDVVEGKIARLTDFGAFTNLGGMDGLVHVSGIAYQHVGKLSDALTTGKDVRAKILPINPREGRISLFIKEVLLGPWTDIETKVAAGTVLDGTVRRLADFGAFVGVFLGVGGLVHISRISHKHTATPHGIFHEGDQIQMKALETDPEEHHTALGIKALEPKPRPQEEPREEQEYELPEENIGFTIGDILGDTLSDAKERE